MSRGWSRRKRGWSEWMAAERRRRASRTRATGKRSMHPLVHGERCAVSRRFASRPTYCPYAAEQLGRQPPRPPSGGRSGAGRSGAGCDSDERHPPSRKCDPASSGDSGDGGGEAAPLPPPRDDSCTPPLPPTAGLANAPPPAAPPPPLPPPPLPPGPAAARARTCCRLCRLPSSPSSRAIASALIWRKTSSSLVQPTPKPERPRAESRGSSAARSACSARSRAAAPSALPGSRTSSSRGESERSAASARCDRASSSTASAEQAGSAAGGVLLAVRRNPTPKCSLRKSGEPAQRRQPSAMIAIRSARSSASSRKCVVSTTVRPRLTSRSSAQMARRECGSMPEVGSSRKRVRAPPAGWRGPDEWMAGCGGPKTRGVCVRSRPQATPRGRACASGRPRVARRGCSLCPRGPPEPGASQLQRARRHPRCAGP
mmetsp:Transcript_21167/g.69025  ORF Transcript_21167/g.69025 Transcript_21167/m.69025 type:complete len:429 (+) Transcript_21167:712-1998(+)